MKKELISVIVPCYNVAEYVSKCLDSIINQSYKDLEIILVEDCSTDDTLEVIKPYLKKDKRIKLIKNDKNKGLSFSRNIGIKNATGEYIGFVDSDDYISSDFYEKLITAAKKEKCDLSICDITVIDKETNNKILCRCFDGDSIDVLSVINTGLAASACNKLFKRELITKYPFAEGKVNEDLAVIIPAIVNATKIAYARDTYYYYIQRKGSIQNVSFSDKRFDIFDGIDTTLDRVRDYVKFEELKDILVYQQLINLFLYVIPKEKDMKRRKKILKKFNKAALKYKIQKNNSLQNFLALQGKKHRLYYKLLINLNCRGFYRTTNLLIKIYDILYNYLKKNVIKRNITIEDIIAAAKKQSKMHDAEIKISVIIPNYNYARFLYERIYSILNQEYKIYEIIILDDKSTDNSVEIIDEIIERIKEYVFVKKIVNSNNSGSAFKQWKKGIDNSDGDYVWIAEADDYCDKDLLKNLAKPLKKNSDCVISYCDTAFIDSIGNILISSIKPEIDIQKTKHWDKSYINNGIDEINKYCYLNNTIANVSSCIIKKGDYGSILKKAGEFHQAGDWLFYVDVMSEGSISYIDKVLNYYRQHGKNVSSTIDYQKHLDELKRIYAYYNKKYILNSEQNKKIKERIAFLKKVWRLK